LSGPVLRRAALIVGLAIGLALGLVYTWGIAPAELTNTYPALLRTDYRWDWVRLTAISYVAEGDLEQARARLDGLEHEDVAHVLETLIEEYATAGRSADAMRRLTTLAQALDVYTPAMLVYLYTPELPSPVPTRTPSPTPTATATPSPTPTSTPTPTPTHTPTPTLEPTSTPTSTLYASSPLPTPTPEPTNTPLPTSTPTPTATATPTPTPPLLARLHLTEKELVCQPGQMPRIEVMVKDEDGEGLAGVEVWLTWPGGADRAVTGLKPQQGAGYADFNAERNVSYALGIGELGIPLVTGVRLEPCPTMGDEEPFIGSWRIVLEP
jgi:hypothetical protein